MASHTRKERATQAEALTNTAMPEHLIPSKKAFERLGFVFATKVGEADADVEIPKGWTRRSAGDFHVLLYDKNGRLRVEVRQRTARLVPRYRVTKSKDSSVDTPWTVVDGSAVLYLGSCGTTDWESYDSRFESAKEWLLDHYPKADDPVAYW